MSSTHGDCEWHIWDFNPGLFGSKSNALSPAPSCFHSSWNLSASVLYLFAFFHFQAAAPLRPIMSSSTSIPFPVAAADPLTSQHP